MTYKEYLERIKMYSKSTAKTYASYEKLFDKHKGDVTKIKLANKASNNTLRITLCALQHYRDFLNMPKVTIDLPKKDIKQQNFVSYQQYLDLLLKYNGRGLKKHETRCIIRLLFETGIRSSELLSIKQKDIIGNKIKIKGKGNRERSITISSWLLSDLLLLKIAKDSYLFNFKYKNLYSRVRRLSKIYKLTPHMFRRGYARYCYSKGVPIYDLSLTMGHSSISTTTTYINKKSEDIDISYIFMNVE